MTWITKILRTYQQGKKYSDLKTDYEELKQKHKATTQQQKIQTQKNQQTQKKLRNTKKELKAAQKIIRSLKDHEFNVQKHREYYQYPSQTKKWTYTTKRNKHGRSLQRQDVRHTLIPQNEEQVRKHTKKIIRETKKYYPEHIQSQDPDQIVTALYKWWTLKADWTYREDHRKGYMEHWPTPLQALKTMTDDCDGKAIAMHTTIYKALRILGHQRSAWRLRFAAVKTLREGHALNIWLGNDGEWYVVESTLDAQNSLKMTWLETPARHNNFYQDWYGFSTKHRSWKGNLDSLEPAKDPSLEHRRK